MTRYNSRLPLALCLLLAAAGLVAQAAQSTPAAAKKKPAPKKTPVAAQPAPEMDPKAVELLKAMSSRLAAAHSMAFTAVITYESPSGYGPALAYTTTSDIVMQRPDKLRVITAADGPATEFYYDGKTMMSFHPAEALVAIADAPPTTDAMLKKLYDAAGTYFPFADLVAADPYGDLAPGLTLAFYIGQSKVVGGTTTEMLAYEAHGVFIQLWIGAEDKLPRMMRAVYFDDLLQLRHQVELSHWQIDSPVAADAFGTSKAAGATRIEFAHPKSKAPKPATTPRPKGKPTPKP